jgi:foldase protein PrsA
MLQSPLIKTLVKGQKIVKRILFSVISLMVLVACSPLPTPTPSPTPTNTPEPTLPPAPPAEDTVELGGIEVALDLITIPDLETIAVVNGEEISTAVYQEELERALYSVTNQYAVDWNDPANQALLPGFQDQVLDQTIDRVLMHQLASQAQITVTPEEIEAKIDLVKAQIEQDATVADWDSFLAENDLTDEIVRDLITDDLLLEALTQLYGGATLVEQVHAVHILVETVETGQEVLDRLADGEDFGALAAEYSTDPGSKDTGGDLGWFPQGMMVPEFEEVAFSLEVGETSDLVQTDYGYHIIHVLEKGERELDSALAAQSQQQQFQTWYQDQKVESSIERMYTFEAPE